MLSADEGRLLTSAGAAAGFDLCVHIVRLDFGSAIAAEAARVTVMPFERFGAQSQSIVPRRRSPCGRSRTTVSSNPCGLITGDSKAPPALHDGAGRLEREPR